MDLLRGLGARMLILKELGEAQRLAVVAANLYPVTRANLVAALDKDLALALDVIKKHNERVYAHVVNNLQDYLDSLEEGKVTVEDPDSFLDVLEDIVATPAQVLRSVALRASESCEVSDLAGLDQEGWHAVVSGGQVPNVRVEREPIRRRAWSHAGVG